MFEITRSILKQFEFSMFNAAKDIPSAIKELDVNEKNFIKVNNEKICLESFNQDNDFASYEIAQLKRDLEYQKQLTNKYVNMSSDAIKKLGCLQDENTNLKQQVKNQVEACKKLGCGIVIPIPKQKCLNCGVMGKFFFKKTPDCPFA